MHSGRHGLTRPKRIEGNKEFGMTQILLADEHAVVLEGLRLQLAANLATWLARWWPKLARKVFDLGQWILPVTDRVFA